MKLDLKLPSLAVTIIGVALAVLVALNTQVFEFGPPWQTGINVVLTVAATLGISIISGPNFQTIIHLPQATCAAIATGLGALQLWLSEASLDGTWRTVLQCVLVVAATLGFGPTLSKKAARLLLALGAAEATVARNAAEHARKGIDG